MMELLPTDAGGMLKPRSLHAFGGPYSLYVRLWRGGVGSPRMIYRGGIAAFDALQREVAGEVAFLTMEELTAGYLFRLNVNQRIACVGLRKSDIDAAELRAYPIRVRTNGSWRTVHRGELRLHLREGNPITLRIVVREYRAIHHYFSRSSLKDRFTTTVGTVGVEEPDDGVLPGLEGLL